MRSLYNDLADMSVITSFNLVGGYDITALLDPRLSRYVLFTYSNGITIKATFENPVTFDSLGLVGHTFTDDLTVSINGSSPVAFGQAGNGFVSFDSVTTDEVTIVLVDGGVDNGSQVQVGRLMLGDVYQMPDINDTLTLEHVSNSNVSFSATRQAYGNPQVRYAVVSVQCPVVDQDDKPALDEMLAEVDNYKPFIVDFDEECFDEGPYYCVLSASGSSAYQFNDAHFWTIGLTFEEVN